MPGTSSFFFDHERMIRSLCELDPTFRLFYERVRAQIPYRLEWRYAPDMRYADGRFGHQLNQRGQISSGVITLRHVQPSASTVAHELLHALHDERGWYVRFGVAQPIFNSLASSLSSLVTDPLVTGDLKAHGFDVEREHLADLADFKRYWLSSSTPKRAPLDEALGYQIFALNARVSGVDPAQVNGLRALIKTFSPRTFRYVQQIETAYRRVPGWRSPSRLAMLGRELVAQLGLKNIWVAQ